VNAPLPRWRGNPATHERDRTDKPPWVRAQSYTLAQAQRVRRPQLRTLMSVDDMVDDVMSTLRDLDELSDTLVIFTSDNGYVWGDHRAGGDYGTAGQKRYPYTSSVKVPFLLRWDGHVPPGTHDARLTSTVDIVPTVLQAAGVVADYPLDGHSLLSSYARQRILLEYWIDPGAPSIPTWISLRTRTLQFVEYLDADGGVAFRELFDLRRDPWQLDNLLADADPDEPDLSALVALVRRDAVCAGNEGSVPTPPTPCP
jgi:arylsulfatase A-like enzyme